jgi:hypothetical protein
MDKDGPRTRSEKLAKARSEMLSPTLLKRDLRHFLQPLAFRPTPTLLNLPRPSSLDFLMSRPSPGRSILSLDQDRRLLLVCLAPDHPRPLSRLLPSLADLVSPKSTPMRSPLFLLLFAESSIQSWIFPRLPYLNPQPSRFLLLLYFALLPSSTAKSELSTCLSAAKPPLLLP